VPLPTKPCAKLKLYYLQFIGVVQQDDHVRMVVESHRSQDGSTGEFLTLVPSWSGQEDFLPPTQLEMGLVSSFVVTTISMELFRHSNVRDLSWSLENHDQMRTMRIR
jgi:hypothetical protein